MWPFDFWNKYPYTDVHELNLDWILKVIKDMKITIDEFVKNYQNPVVVERYQDIENHNYIYLYTGEDYLTWQNKHWYYWSESDNEWKDGGLYGSIALDDKFDADSDKALKNSVITNFLHPSDASTNKILYTKDDSIVYGEPYVTPEMFGAVGDGLTDDSTAIQQAIDTNKPILFEHEKYSLGNNEINFNDKSYYEFDASNIEFIYSGTDHAFKFLHDTYSNFKFGRIYSPSGGCILFYGTDSHMTSDGQTVRDWSMYCNLYIGGLYAGDTKNCITVDSQGTNWINEIRVHDVRFEHGENGYYLMNNSPYGTSHWVFYNNGVEGVNYGYNLNVGANGVGNSSFTWFGTRTAEATTIIKARGNNHDFVFYDALYFGSNKTDIDTDCDRWTIFGGGDILLVEKGVFRWSAFRRLYNLQQGVPISKNSDLNSTDFVVPDIYTSESNEISQSLSNCPVDGPFTMMVKSADGKIVTKTSNWSYIIREISRAGTTDVYRQQANSNGSGTWAYGKWKQFSDVNYNTIDIGQYTLPENGQVTIDLDTSVLSTGNYIISIASTTTAYWNWIGTIMFKDQMHLEEFSKYGDALTVSLSRTSTNAGVLTIANSGHVNTVNIKFTKIS